MGLVRTQIDTTTIEITIEYVQNLTTSTHRAYLDGLCIHFERTVSQHIAEILAQPYLVLITIYNI